MKWKVSPSAIEYAVASLAALCLGGAIGFAVARIAPLGVGLVQAIAMGAIAAFVALKIIEGVDRRHESRGHGFVPAAPLAAGPESDDVLLLEQRVDDDGVLLLDEPLSLPGDQSRVVRLFAAQPDLPAAAPPLAGPGEMLSRIEQFLGHARGAAPVEPPRREDNAASDDARAALHAALADIRRSLRQG